MDVLTHLFLPLAIVIVYREDLASTWPMLGIAGFALLPDVDKFLGMQGLFHSLVTLLPICLGILVVERWIRGHLDLSLVIVVLIGSHLLLDFIDGGPVPLLFPFIESGLGLQYPGQLVFGEGILGVTIQGPLVTIGTPVPRSGYQSFGFLNGTGVLSLLAFGSIYASQRGLWSKVHSRTPVGAPDGEDGPNAAEEARE